MFSPMMRRAFNCRTSAVSATGITNRLTKVGVQVKLANFSTANGPRTSRAISSSFVKSTIAQAKPYPRIITKLSPSYGQLRSYAHYKRFQQAGGSSSGVSLSRLLLNRFVLLFVGGCVFFYVYNLDEAPYTHRRRFLWIPYWLEEKIGDYSYEQILAQFQGQLASPMDPNYLLIRHVMNRLLATAIDGCKDPQQAAHLKSLDWTIHIINVKNALEEPPNAFILPNGKIFIFSSILPICKNQDGLATVLSHELSHQLAHHSLEQLSKQPIYIMLSTMLYVATGISWFTDLLVTGLFQMPASREMESEADRIGCELMARLCFNVEDAVNFWARMENWEQQAKKNMITLNDTLIGEFFASHPNTNKRISDIKKWMPELLQMRENSNCDHWGTFQDFSRNFFGKK
ncbi:CIC11C00000000369 [Sungouiella intermedia]|uniref:CIC11C00000000369 n=1 Tax=Sungouiella intermedia TaxID=45354 RepID=A0A1L0BE38_9ASCO|nr:CIC11C00000000369 [[Candida] intermedia]